MRQFQVLIKKRITQGLSDDEMHELLALAKDSEERQQILDLLFAETVCLPDAEAAFEAHMKRIARVL